MHQAPKARRIRFGAQKLNEEAEFGENKEPIRMKKRGSSFTCLVVSCLKKFHILKRRKRRS